MILYSVCVVCVNIILNWYSALPLFDFNLSCYWRVAFFFLVFVLKLRSLWVWLDNIIMNCALWPMAICFYFFFLSSITKCTHAHVLTNADEMKFQYFLLIQRIHEYIWLPSRFIDAHLMHWMPLVPILKIYCCWPPPPSDDNNLYMAHPSKSIQNVNAVTTTKKSPQENLSSVRSH